MKEKVIALTERESLELDHAMNSDFRCIMKEMTKNVHEGNPEGSFKRVFWDQQLKASQIQDSRQLRWYPAMIKWCLYLKFISSGAYHALRKSGLVTLPSERTLWDYTHWIRSGVGFMQEVDAQLVSEADIQEDKDRSDLHKFQNNYRITGLSPKLALYRYTLF